MPSFSVIIPAYQEEKAIQRAIAETARVFQGLGVDFEIIVVDDGSRDRTSEMALRGVDGLKLVDGNGNLVPGPFNDSGERTFNYLGS